MKRILILYAKYGGGHLSAANSIQTYLEENYLDSEIMCIDCVEYVNAFLSAITTSAYKQMAKKAPYVWKKVYYNSQKGILSNFSSYANRKMSNKLLDIFKLFLPDIVISTHPFGTQMTTYLKENNKINCKLATVMTDFAPHDQWLVGKDFCDYFFVSTEKMKQDLINRQIPANKVFATGIPLSRRFQLDFDKDEIFKQFCLDINKKVILFFGGGEFGLGKNRTVQVLHSLVKHLDQYQIVAISGKNKQMNKEFLKLYNKIKNDNLHILKYTKHVPELMYISSLVVTKPGGLTSSESLASGLPMVIINPIPGQEEENAEYLESAGVGVWIKKEDNIDECINNLLNNPTKLDEMKEKCYSISSVNATELICRIIMDSSN